MIKIEEVDVWGWDSAIRGMRNPMNSWDKSDSVFCGLGEACDCTCLKYYECPLVDDENGTRYYHIGPNDLKLMKNLVKAGNDHAKFMRMINVTMDITAPLYWWKEFDTYKVGTVANSCSTMHKIHAKEFTLDDFSHDKLNKDGKEILKAIIYTLNACRLHYVDFKDKEYWWQMIQLLPTSYNQKRTIQLNYAVLKNMYHSRRSHKLDEWVEFCKWIETLPYAELIMGKEN